MGIFNFNRLRQSEGKIINQVENSFPKEKKDYVPNRNVGKRVTTEEFEDEYTTATRKEKILSGEIGTEEQVDTFIDAEGNKTPIHELNGQTEELLKEARESINAEMRKEKALEKIDTSHEDTERKLSVKRALNEVWYATHRDPSENLKTNSPAKRKLDIRKTREALGKADYADPREEAEQDILETMAEHEHYQDAKEADLDKSI